MINGLAVLLAALMIPTAQSNAVMPENYSPAEPRYVQQANNDTATIYTPNGTGITVTCPPNVVVDEGEWHRRTYFFVSTDKASEKPEISGWYENLDGEEVTLKDKGILRKGDPTTTYNNLAFAFYMYWEEGQYFEYAMHCELGSIEAYLNDYSYTVVKNEPQVDDIVLYYNTSGFIQTAGVIREVYAEEANDTASDEAFVRQLSKYKIWSKWNEYGVYEHRGDLSPFVGKYATSKVTGTATANVVYLRRHETHSYTHRYAKIDENNHYAYCECGDRIKACHILIRTTNRRQYCKYCYYITPIPTVPTLADTINFDYNDIDYKKIAGTGINKS